MFEYWNYYDEEFDWTEKSVSLTPSKEYTLQKLLAQGISEEDAIKLYNSGFVCFEGYNVLIDRFYGGPLNSFDFRTRFPLSEAKMLLDQTYKSNITTEKITSIDELRDVIHSMKKTNHNLIFRGQSKSYSLEREIKNPYFNIKDYGEISLLPSIWRVMYKKNKFSFTEFNSLSLFEWSEIFYSAFDIPEIERRHRKLNDLGEMIYTMSDMEDCSDNMLREFGKFRMDLAMGMDYNLLTTLTTLLQHYGLYSPVLDLTESLEVALFFATHTYQKVDKISKYNFVGSNNRQSVIYVLSFDSNEMEKHDGRDEFLKYLEPQRPIKQKCVVCRTNQFSINLPAYYIKKILILDFDISSNICGIVPEDIFPGKDTDKFLKALLEKVYARENVTAFKKEDIIL